MMAALTQGDVVIIPAVDRLSRDTTDLLVIARDMQRAGAGLRSLAEPVVDTTSDFAELVLAMLGVAAKLERRRIAERTARGCADAKAKGVKYGRKPSLTSHQQQEARERLAAGETQRGRWRRHRSRRNVRELRVRGLTTHMWGPRVCGLPRLPACPPRADREKTLPWGGRMSRVNPAPP
jgi:DNA invertase Pin-like site-specific DNA recombinase